MCLAFWKEANYHNCATAIIARLQTPSAFQHTEDICIGFCPQHWCANNKDNFRAMKGLGEILCHSRRELCMTCTSAKQDTEKALTMQECKLVFNQGAGQECSQDKGQRLFENFARPWASRYFPEP